MSKADHFIARIRHLPPAPTVLTQLLPLFSDPDRDLDRIVELISVDQVLTAEVLKRCNSAAFGADNPATDVFEALSRLGFYEVYCLVAALMGSRAVAINDQTGGVNSGELWRHSVVTAVAAGALARRVDESDAIAFTVGLLHDIGKTILATVEPRIYITLLSASGVHGAKLVLAEELRFGVSHAEVGGSLMARWGLPSAVVASVMAHHQSPTTATGCERLAATVQIGNLLAQHLNGGSTPGDCLRHEQESLALLQLTPGDVPGLLEKTQSGLDRVQGLLALGN